MEIAFEKHRWRRDAGRDGRCGSEIRKEKWKERYGGKIVEIACEKHRWRRDAGRDGRLHKKSNIDKRLVIENGICSPLLTVFESVRSTAP